MGTPTAERPPRGLDANWLGVWRHALKTLQKQGSWAGTRVIRGRSRRVHRRRFRPDRPPDVVTSRP
jgi:hypothetical protein